VAAFRRASSVPQHSSDRQQERERRRLVRRHSSGECGIHRRLEHMDPVVALAAAISYGRVADLEVPG